MAKEKKKFTLPPSEFLKKHGDDNFILVAIPEELVIEIDRVRDAIVDYMPGYDEKDFEILRQTLDWVDNIEQLLCVRDGK
jgi:hypothetical protein